ncbi:hypothetical protein CRM22_002197 [Opisthorchis felineus]|uniref:F5/8 type C domain-containing protein n=1 Tax=Opisthorchis felineus TaxID=147828 RepID=A0A4V3SGG4_OPIFE|nr:hypothetical protein CRM22_002197 [Opisthorchis felineus]
MDFSFWFVLCGIQAISAVNSLDKESSIHKTWRSQYMVKFNVTDNVQEIIWSLVASRSNNWFSGYNDSGDWIQMDLVKYRLSGGTNSLRLYLDEHRLLRTCLFNPDNVGKPVPPEADSFPLTK